MKARDTIRKEARRLRKIAEGNGDAATARMAYAMANTLDWTLGNTKEPPTKDLPVEVNCLFDDLRREGRIG